MVMQGVQRRKAEVTFIETAKLLRMMELIHKLSRGAYTVRELAEEFESSKRTMYRYLHILEIAGFKIDLHDDDNRAYKINTTNCPICGKYNQQPLTNEMDNPNSEAKADGQAGAYSSTH